MKRVNNRLVSGERRLMRDLYAESEAMQIPPAVRAVLGAYFRALGREEFNCLVLGLAADDPTLIAGQATEPAYAGSESLPCKKGDLFCYPILKAMGRATVREVSERANQILTDIDGTLKFHFSFLSLADWWDRTDRDIARWLVLAEARSYRRAMQSRN